MTPPPNSPAEVEVDEEAGRLWLHYNGHILLELVRTAPNIGPIRVHIATHESGQVEQIITLTAADGNSEGAFWGTVFASDEAFPAETLTNAQERFPLIRTCDGLSHNHRNNAIYDRRYDWVLFGPGDGLTRIAPISTVPGEIQSFDFAITGAECELTFRPRYYQKHKNLPYYEPWTYRPWRESVTGWCSWWAYWDRIAEDDVLQVADVFADKFSDFDCRYIQIDDGYQHSKGGLPGDWLTTNEKFPNGLAALAEAIRARGLDPALWVNVHFGDEGFVNAHPDWFVQDADGKPHKGPWIDYAWDGLNPDAMEAIVRPLYRAFAAQGWNYVKIDTLRHLLYDAIDPCRAYFERKGQSGDAAFRRVLEIAREELGSKTYILACWGVITEAIGLVDGCRLGGDGFGPATLQQFNSWNNVVWRNDPDHVDIAPEGEEILRPVLISMAGAQMLLSDTAEFYQDDARLEGVKRTSPVLFTWPGQLYDYEPIISDNIRNGLRNQGGSDAGPRDAVQSGPICPWWLLEIQRPFETWNVLARLRWDALEETEVQFADLGLDTACDYIIHEFWSENTLGIFHNHFTAAAQQAKETCVYAIRQLQNRPQIVSTNRHITQGGVDLRETAWDDTALCLSGESDVVAQDPYRITLRVPPGFELLRAETGGQSAQISGTGEYRTLSIIPERTGSLTWAAHFQRAAD